MIPIGMKVPAFQLKDQNGLVHSSTDLPGKHILLSFHPLAWTGVCQLQMEALEMNASAFAELTDTAFGVSVDSIPCKKAWAESMTVSQTALLADFWPHGGLAQSLGIFREVEGISECANVIVDSEGIVRWIKVYPMGEVPDVEEVLAVLKELRS